MWARGGVWMIGAVDCAGAEETRRRGKRCRRDVLRSSSELPQVGSGSGSGGSDGTHELVRNLLDQVRVPNRVPDQVRAETLGK